MQTISTRLLLLTALSVGGGSQLTSPPSAQTFKLSESFEDNGSAQSGDVGPPNLASQGWIFRNQSQPTGSVPAWVDSVGVGGPHAGAGFLSSWLPGFPSQELLSNWAVLPAVPGQTAGDVLAFWVLGGDLPPWPISLEVRYSNSGGTDTGTGPTDVGDFDQVLFQQLLPLSGTFQYAEVQVTLPGPGRVALRYESPNVGGFQLQTSALISIDTLTVGDTPAGGPPCGLMLPASGETVTWDAAGSPYTICQDLTIPAGATLIVEAGATVEFASTSPPNTLTIAGELRLEGHVAAPVVAKGGVSSFVVPSGGSVRVEHGDVDASFVLLAGSSFEASDSLLREDTRFAPAYAGSFVRLERCELRSEWIELGGTTVLDDVQLTNPAIGVAEIRGFWRIESLESSVPIGFTASLQDRLIDNVTITGVSWAPAIELQAFESVADFRLGSGNVLQGNQVPVWARRAGLRASSVVPLAGNLRDAIRAPEIASAALRSRLTLPNFGVPYDIDGTVSWKGDLRIDPGTRFAMGHFAELHTGGDSSRDTVLRGLPGEPLVFERRLRDQPWGSIENTFGLALFEHLVVDGAQEGVRANDTLSLRDSTLSNCDLGTHVVGGARLEADGNLWIGNQTGLHVTAGNVDADGVERANQFVQNQVGALLQSPGVLDVLRAERNWWGAGSGPFSATQNPSGKGDTASLGVAFQPFLTVEPDWSDTRPVVRLTTRLHPVVESGEKLFLEWTATDDGALVGFDVQWFDPQALGFVDLASDLPPSTRRYELLVPDIAFEPNFPRMPFRILAHDDAGQTGIEPFWLIVPAEPSSAPVVFETQLGTHFGGEKLKVCYDAPGIQSTTFTEIRVETSADDRFGLKVNGSIGTDQCALSDLTLPHASTNRARLALRADGTGSLDEWYFSDYFTIRPDPRFGDEAPTVSMVTPIAGQTFVGGQSVLISWAADDDVGLEEFRIQASLNGGRTFHTLADSLLPTVRSFVWRLPASTGVADVRVRVVAVDTLLQNTADGDDRQIVILPGSPPSPGQKAPDRAAAGGLSQ